MYSVSVVVPAYNEEKAIKGVLQSVLSALTKYGGRYEVVVLDDGSSDKTREYAMQIADENPGVVRIISNDTNKGIAYTLDRLYRAARMDYVLDIPGDGQVDPEVISRIVPLLSGVDILVCKRRDKFYGIYRWIVSTGYVWSIKLLFGMDLFDPGCSKCVKREIRQKYKTISRGVFAEAERCIRAVDEGYKIGKVYIDLSTKYKGHGSGASLVLVLEALGDLFRFWRHRRRELSVGSGEAKSETEL